MPEKNSAAKPFRHRKLIAGVLIAVAIVVIALLIAQDEETLRVKSALSANDPRLPEYLAHLVGHPLVSGDSYVVHTNGDQAFPAMLAAIAAAKYRVSFETYIFEKGQVGAQFTTAFEAAARRGVRVQMVLDAVGVKSLDPVDRERLERAGCRIGWFNPVVGYSIQQVNYRTHRKALVVDGDVAFVGGMGIADQWAHDTDRERLWRDTQIEVRGPGALLIEAGFNQNWIETGGVVEPDLTPVRTAPAGPGRSIVVWSAPQAGPNALKLLFLLAIAAAQHSLDIESPYVITDESTQWSLQDARRRGVRVRILMEGDVTDAKPVKDASRNDYGVFLSQGIELFEYQPAMMHAKVTLIDGVVSIVGSANFDNRSLELNHELNVAVFDPGLAARLLVDFERDLSQSKRIDLESWRARSLFTRGRERFWSYFGEVF